MASMSEIQNFLNKNRSKLRNLFREENDRREASGLPILTQQEIHVRLSDIVDQEKFNLLARAGSRIFGDDELPKPSPFTYLPALSQSRAPASVGKKEADEKKLYDEEQKKKADLCTYKPGMKIEEFIENLFKAGVEPARKKWLETFKRCVLPTQVKEMIEEALTMVLLSHKFQEWGINDAFEKGLTNSILLYGPPGTGKTMIAESFAAVLDKNLLKVDTATIQSQIPGEAERNIKSNFEKAQKENAVLMFDECDSLLYNRDAVGAIMAAEINCLLTELERFDGVVILTTNRLGRLDPALQRRIIAKIELGLPGQMERARIWKNLVPTKMPIGEIDFNKLAKDPIAGGDIKNAILLAARKAIAMNAEKVEMEHFQNALRTVVQSKKDFENAQPEIISGASDLGMVGAQIHKTIVRHGKELKRMEATA